MNFDNHKLNLNLSWRIGEESFLKIVDLIHQKLNQPKYIIEFGSGASSIRLALNFPNTKIISIEADQQSYHETQNLAKEFLDEENNLELQYKHLSFQKYGAGKILSYTQDVSLEKLRIDCVIIDGPPFYTLRGREACLYQIYSQLMIGGIVILDDFNRESEKIILKNWLSVYPDSFEVEIIEVEHHLAILKKIQSVQPKWNNQFKYDDSMIVNETYNKIKQAILHFNNHELKDLINYLPPNLVTPWQLSDDNRDDFVRLMVAIKETYNIAFKES